MRNATWISFHILFATQAVLIVSAGRGLETGGPRNDRPPEIMIKDRKRFLHLGLESNVGGKKNDSIKLLSPLGGWRKEPIRSRAILTTTKALLK